MTDVRSEVDQTVQREPKILERTNTELVLDAITSGHTQQTDAIHSSAVRALHSFLGISGSYAVKMAKDCYTCITRYSTVRQK